MASGSVRRAGPDDVDALVRLRCAMVESWGQDPAGPWQDACRAALARRLAGPDFAAFVAEEAGAVVAGGVGWLEEHLPGPVNPTGRRGWISNMSTLPAARRRGHGRAVLHALLDWLRAQGVVRVDLRATPAGEPLYRAAGFTIATGLPMTLRLDGG